METDVIVVFQEHVGMVAAFSQLHHEIGQSSCGYLAWVFIEFKSSLSGNVIVDQLLPSWKFYLYDVFLLFWKLGLHFFFDSPQQKWP